MSATATLDQPHLNPLRREGLLGRVAPFAGVTLLVAPLTLLSPLHVDGRLILPALLLTVVIITSP